MSSQIVTMDLGSNSFRVLQYDRQTQTIIAEFDKTVGTADGLKQTKKISHEALQRVITAIKQSKEKLGFDAKDVIAVTTSAMRQAHNAHEILLQIEQATGVLFEVISGKQEAELTLLAIKKALKRERLDSSDFIVVDIGGGSTEIMLCTQEQTLSKSFQLGIVTLSQSSQKEKTLKKYSKKIEDFLQKQNLVSSYQLLPLISTAGTPTTIAAIKQGLDYKSYDKTKINGTVLTLKELRYYYEYLQNKTKKEADILAGKGRSEYMFAGIEIFELVYTLLGKNESIVFDDGLKEGILYNAL